VRFALLIAAVTLVLIALARPQWGFTWEESKQKGLDIVVAIDTSKSMLAEDIAPNRLTRAKLAALDLMQQAKSDRLGLVAFAGGAFLQCPLTIDDNAFRQSVESLDVNIIPQGGTAVAEAITTALTAFKEGDNFKVLVLFTDGEDNDENAVSAAEAAAKEGMKIFTIGIGTAEGELLRVKDAKGRTDYIRDAEGNVVKSRLNEGLLQQIAGATEGGFYLPLRGAKTIDTLYEKGLAPLPKSEGQEKLVKRFHERYHWPLGLALLLLLIEVLLPERRRAKPQTANPSASVSAVLAAFVLLPAVAGASPASALKAFNAGQFTNALTEYERLLTEQTKQQKPEDPRLHFNAGAVAYRATNYTAALQHFTSVLSASDIKLQAKAYYNLGNVHFRLGQQGRTWTSWRNPGRKPSTSTNMCWLWKKAIRMRPSTWRLSKRR
jgi:Ca-activated chloride channel family protein